MTYWLFQGNPKYYRIIDGIRDFEQMPWLATRYAKEMAAGDGVLFEVIVAFISILSAIATLEWSIIANGFKLIPIFILGFHAGLTIT